MNINKLTIGQAKEIAALVGAASGASSSLTASMIGKYVIVRSRNEGVNAGFVKAADETGVILTDARRIWYHKPKDKSLAWYEGVAISGVSDDSKLSAAVSTKAIVEDYSLTECTKDAQLLIEGAPAHGQN